MNINISNIIKIYTCNYNALFTIVKESACLVHYDSSIVGKKDKIMYNLFQPLFAYHWLYFINSYNKLDIVYLYETRGSSWIFREIYDMFNINHTHHDCRKILLNYTAKRGVLL